MRLLGVGQRICIASPKTLNISRLGTELGLSACGIPLRLRPPVLDEGNCSVRKGEYMSFRVVFLGTSGSVPTLKRSLPCVVVQCPRDQWMFDCGENVQRQMMQGKVSFHRKMNFYHSPARRPRAWVARTFADDGAYGPQRTRTNLWTRRTQGFSGLHQRNTQLRLNYSQ